MTATIHRCAECNHKHTDHEEEAARCSFGGCACRLTVAQVVAANPAVEIPTFPARPTRLPLR